jgi:hypothetical protein
VIGTPENDAALRLECWKVGVEMAGGGRFDADNVAKLASAAYTFIASGEKSPSSDSRDKPSKAPKR